jgi:hypothetical protein
VLGLSQCIFDQGTALSRRFATDGIVGRVEDKDDALRRRWLALEKQADEQPFHRSLVQAQLAIAVFARPWRVFEPIQRRLSGQNRRASSLLDSRPSAGS